VREDSSSTAPGQNSWWDFDSAESTVQINLPSCTKSQKEDLVCTCKCMSSRGSPPNHICTLVALNKINCNTINETIL